MLPALWELEFLELGEPPSRVQALRPKIEGISKKASFFEEFDP